MTLFLNLFISEGYYFPIPKFHLGFTDYCLKALSIFEHYFTVYIHKMAPFFRTSGGVSLKSDSPIHFSKISKTSKISVTIYKLYIASNSVPSNINKNARPTSIPNTPR